MPSYSYLLAFVLIVTGLSVFSTPSGAHALELPAHAYARRAAPLLGHPLRRRGTRAWKRRLANDGALHELARRQTAKSAGTTKAAEDTDAGDEDTDTTKSSGSGDGDGFISHGVHAAGGAIRDGAVAIGSTAVEATEGTASLLDKGIRGTANVALEGARGIGRMGSDLVSGTLEEGGKFVDGFTGMFHHKSSTSASSTADADEEVQPKHADKAHPKGKTPGTPNGAGALSSSTKQSTDPENEDSAPAKSGKSGPQNLFNLAAEKQHSSDTAPASSLHHPLPAAHGGFGPGNHPLSHQSSHAAVYRRDVQPQPSSSVLRRSEGGKSRLDPTY